MFLRGVSPLPEFVNRTVHIGYKGHSELAYEKSRHLPSVFHLGDYYYYFTAEMRAAIGCTWRVCRLCTIGLTTLANASTSYYRLMYIMNPQHFFCPSQWQAKMDSTHRFTQSNMHLYEDAVSQFHIPLLGAMVSLEAHKRFWAFLSKQVPSERVVLSAEEIMQKYGHAAKQRVAQNRLFGIVKWDNIDADGCGNYFDDCEEGQNEHTIMD